MSSKYWAETQSQSHSRGTSLFIVLLFGIPQYGNLCLPAFVHETYAIVWFAALTCCTCPLRRESQKSFKVTAHMGLGIMPNAQLCKLKSNRMWTAVKLLPGVCQLLYSASLLLSCSGADAPKTGSTIWPLLSSLLQS